MAYKKNVIGRAGNDGIKNTEIWVPLKYLSNFWRTLQMPLINCEINLILTWSEDYILISGGIDDQAPKFAITDTKFYAPVVTLLVQANVKLLDQLKHVFKKSNWNKYQSKVSTQTKSQNLDYLVDPSFQGVNRFFVLSFENNAYRTSYKR